MNDNNSFLKSVINLLHYKLIIQIQNLYLYSQNFDLPLTLNMKL